MSVRVAVWQCRSQPGEVGANLDRLALVCERASDEGVDLVVTPEMYLTGYAISAELTRRLAEPVDGPMVDAVADLSRRTGVAVAVGYPETGPDSGVSNAAVLVDGGKVIGRHRKLHLWDEIDRRRFTPAPATSDVVELRGHRVGLLICYDVEFPEAVRDLRVRGAEIVLVPTANMVGYEPVNTVLVPARALENGCFVAYANYAGTEGDLTYCGLSTVCGPTGVIERATEGAEALLMADLDTDLVDPGYLADRRADLYDRPSGPAPDSP